MCYYFSRNNLPYDQERRVDVVKYMICAILALSMVAVCSCGSYPGARNQTGKIQLGMDKDRTHRYEEGQQRRIDEDRQRRKEMDRNSNTGSIRYFIY